MAPMTAAAPTVAVIDTETTGFKYNGDDRILELAVVRVSSDGTEECRWSTLLNPGETVDIGPVHVHGITREHLVSAPTFSDVAGDIIELMRGAVIVAHNAPFDIGFLKAEFRRAGLLWPDPVTADTLGAARFLLPGLPAYKLGSLAEHLGIEFDGAAHSALADALVTAQLFRRLLSMTANVPWPASVDVQWPALMPSGLQVTR